MSPRPARLAVVPDPPPAPERMMTITELADRLQVSRSKIERDIIGGLPCLDVGHHHEGRRRKRSLRFSWPAVIAWYRSRP